MTSPSTPSPPSAPPTQIPSFAPEERASASGELPGRPSRRRRLAGWGAFAAALVLLGIVAAVIADASRWSARGVLDPESAAPEGARAIVRVLQERGIDVRVERDAASARAAADSDATLVLPDAAGLTDGEVADLARAAGTVVLVEPRAASLAALFPGSASAGFAGDAPLEADCEDAGRAGEIVAGELYSAGEGVEGCFAEDGGYALLRAEDGERTLFAVDGRALFANDAVAQSGNAALSLSILGQHHTLVWYVPSLADVAREGAPTLGELTPRWVSPVAVLLIVAAIVAAVWRGRRFGPLVAENLPVTVRASETSVGRGRLYAQHRDAAHALDQLRHAARRRLAALLGLPAHAGANDIADAVAARVGTDRSAVRDILIDAVPTDDRSLVALDARLRELEARVRAALRVDTTSSEGKHP